jgi:menaquinone-9 beta-reductase
VRPSKVWGVVHDAAAAGEAQDRPMNLKGNSYDVAVVGASLAGCTTAALLGRAGFRVALIDKHSGPDAYKRLCGHYIQASATPVIRRLGLADAIEAAGGVRNGVNVWTRWGSIPPSEPPEERPYGYSVRRSALDPLVRRLAAESPGVEYMPGLEVAGLLGDEDGVTGVELRDRRRQSMPVAARLVVGADGRNSSVARLAGARERHALNERFCYMAYFAGIQERDGAPARFWVLDPDVAIVSPNDGGLSLLAVFLHKRHLPKFRADRERALRRVFAQLPEPPELAGAEMVGKMVGYTNYEPIRRDVTPRPGVALVGDAALTSDPVMAIGCGWALQSAEWLSDAVGPALTESRSVDSALESYRRIHRKRIVPHDRMLVADAKARGLNPIQRLLFSAAVKDRQIAATFHRYAERSISPGRLLSPRVLARAARINARAAALSR